MKILQLPPNKNKIINLLIEWTELIVEEKYQQAIDMFLVDEFENYNAKILEQAVYTYGVVGYTKEEALKKYGYLNKATSILKSPHKDYIINNSIRIDIYDEDTIGEGAINDYILFLGKNKIIGFIDYDDFLLNGKMSDLTARFYIKKLNEKEYTLIFQDLHVL